MPVSVEVLNSEGKSSGTLEVSDRLLGVPENPHVVRAALDCYLANQRQGDAATRSRGMVRGGGRKPWKQKGTGHARAGSRRSPLWPGGGITFGPKPRDYGYRLNHKVRQLAFLSVMSSLQREKHLIVLEQIQLREPKTRHVVNLRERLGIKPGQKALILTESSDPDLTRAASNLGPDSDYPTRVLPKNNLNIHELLCCDYLVLPTVVLKSLEEVYG